MHPCCPAERERKLWKPDDELRRKYGGADAFATSAPPPPPPSSSAKPKKGAKKKSQMELFKEKIKLKQAEDAARRALKTPEALAREDELAKLPPPPVRSHPPRPARTSQSFRASSGRIYCVYGDGELGADQSILFSGGAACPLLCAGGAG